MSKYSKEEKEQRKELGKQKQNCNDCNTSWIYQGNKNMKPKCPVCHT